MPGKRSNRSDLEEQLLDAAPFEQEDQPIAVDQQEEDGVLVDHDDEEQVRHVRLRASEIPPADAGIVLAQEDSLIADPQQQQQSDDSSSATQALIPAPYRYDRSQPITFKQAYPLINSYFEHPSRSSYHNVHDFLTFDFRKAWTLGVDKDKETGEEKFCWNATKGYEYVKLSVPLGVLSYSKIDYIGSIHEKGDRAPKTLYDIKQSIDWSPRKFDETNVAPDGIHDATAFEVVRKGEELNRYFVEQLFGLDGKYDLATKWCEESRKVVRKRFKSRPIIDETTKKPREPTPAEVNQEAFEDFLISPMLYSIFKTSTANDWIRAGFATKLLKALPKNPSAKQIEWIKKHPYKPPNKDLAIVWNSHKLMLNDIHFWVVKDQSDIDGPDGWGKSLSFLTEVQRKDVFINDGDIGSVIFTIAPGNAGSSSIGPLAFLSGVVWYSRPTFLSSITHKCGPVPDHVAALVKQEPPVFPRETRYHPEAQKKIKSETPEEELIEYRAKTTGAFKLLAGASVAAQMPPLLMPVPSSSSGSPRVEEA